MSCMAQAGLEYSEQRNPNGTPQFTITHASGASEAEIERDQATYRDCERQTGDGSIPAIHFQQQVNPQHEDWATLELACLKAGGFVPESLTVDEFTLTLPDLGQSLTDPAAQRCFTDPKGLLGGS